MKKLITPLRIVSLLLGILTVAVLVNKGLLKEFLKSALADSFPTISQGTPWTTSTSLTSFDAHVIGFYEPSPIGNIQFQLNGGTWTDCTADDGTFDAQDADEPATCSITDLTMGATNHIKFKAIGTDLVETEPANYLSLDLDVSESSVSLTNKSEFLTTAGNFVFTGSAHGNGNVTDVKWRNYINGQAADVNWSDCSATDGTFDSVDEAYTCTIPTTSTDGEYHFEIKEDDASGFPSPHVFPTAMLDTAKKIDTWFDMTNTTNGGEHSGNSRSFGAITQEGTPTQTTGEFNDSAVAFDGSTDFVMPDSTPYLDYSGLSRSFSIHARFKPDVNNGNNRTIFFKNWEPGNENISSFWGIWINPDGKVVSGLRLGLHQFSQDGNDLTASTNSVNYGAWNDVVVSWDVEHRITCLKLNGDTANCTAWLFPDPVFSSTGDVYVGKGESDALGLAHFTGEIDDIYVTRTADATPPIITISPLAIPDRVTTATPTFTLTFNDANGGVASGEYYITSDTQGPGLNEWVVITTPDDGNWGGVAETATITTPHLDDGVSSITVNSTDINGNTNVHYDYVTSPFFQPIYSFYIETQDTTAPIISTNAVLPNPTIDKHPAIRGYVKDYLQSTDTGDTASNIADISYSIDDGGDFTSILPIDGVYDSPKEDFYFQLPYDLSLGTHTVQIRAVDAAGNSTANNPVNGSNGDVLMTFTVNDPVGTPISEDVVKNITFNNHDLHDAIFSDAVWGNGMIRLRQKINFSEAIDNTPPINHDTYGYLYGSSNLSVWPSSDGNLWVAGTDGSLTYYNTATKAETYYSFTKLGKTFGSEISKVFEFTDGGERYLMISYTNEGTTIIYDINNTPENTADDPAPVDYANKAGFPDRYDMFEPYAIDTRGATLAIYGMTQWTSTENPIIRLDLNGTPMDLSDDTVTAWGHSMRVGDDGSGVYQGGSSGFTAFYFDQSSHIFLAFNYGQGLYICDDNNTPTDTSDDTCTTPSDAGSSAVAYNAFDVIKDPNGWYWIGGDNGLVRLNLNGTPNDRSDDSIVSMMTPSQIAGDHISALKWQPGVYPVGAEIWAMTREGRIRAIEYNDTYDDQLDDTWYSYKINQFDYVRGGVNPFYMSDRNTIWEGVPGRGIDKITLDRTYEDANTIEIYPVPPANLLEVDHVQLSDVVGTVSAGSPYTLNDLVTYDVSNDAGATWHPANIGDTIDFTNSDYKLKIQINMHKGSTPIMSAITISYIAQPAGTIANGPLVTPTTTTTTSSPSGAPVCTAAAPIGAPSLFKITRSGTAATLWFTPINSNSTGYSVIYGNVPNQDIFGTTFNQGPSTGALSYTIYGLNPALPYSFKIRAVNDCTAGPWSSYLSINPLGKKPTLTATPTSAPIISPGIIIPGTLPSGASPVVTNYGTNSPNIPITQIINVSKIVSGILAVIFAVLAAFAAAAAIVNTLIQVISGLLPIYSISGRSLINLPFDFLSDFIKGFWQSMAAFFTSLFGFVFKKFDKRGIVFDSANGKPVEGAYLIMFSSSGNLISAFSDRNGRYSFAPKPDNYSLKADRINYIFPSQLVNIPSNGIYSHIYLNGEKFEINSKGEKIYDVAIPLDPKVNLSIFNKLFIKIGLIWNSTIGKLSILLEVISLISVGIAAYFDPSWIYKAVFAVLIVIYLLQIIFRLKKHAVRPS